MGIEMSTSYVSLRENPLLHALVGDRAIPEGDNFWNELLNFSFNPPTTISDCRLLADMLQDSLSLFTQNDAVTKHFLRITNCFLNRAPSLADNTMSRNEIFMQKTLNALFLTRMFLQFFIQNESHAEVLQHFSTRKVTSRTQHTRSKSDTNRITADIKTSFLLPHLSPVIPIRQTGLTRSAISTSNDSIEKMTRPRHTDTLYGKLIHSLFTIITEVDIKQTTILIHLEALRFLTVILGTQLFSRSLDPDGDTFLTTLLLIKKSTIIEVVIHLLDNITRFSITAPIVITEQNSYFSYVPGYSWLFGSNTEATSNSTPPPNSPVNSSTEELIRNFSTSLLLVLILQTPLKDCTENPYRSVFSNFKDFADSPPTSSPGLVTSYERFYSSICAFLHKQDTVLLLYQTLLRHSPMKSFIWSQTEFSPLILPLLETLNSAETTSLHHLYMISIILLMMSQDTGYCTCIHTQIITTVPWYKEKLVGISLGSLLVLSLLNLLVTNITQLRDQYIHTNCSAILANIASKIQNLHVIPSLKIINVFEGIAKKYTQVKNAGNEKSSEECSVVLLEGILHIILALINSILAKNLAYNSQLVYNLIYRKEVFLKFRTHPEFCMLIENIFSVVDFFESQLKIYAVFSTSEEGLEVLGELSRRWPADGLRRFPEQKYKYCEEEEPREFFIPYIWTLIYQQSGLYWQHSKIKLAWNTPEVNSRELQF